MPCAVNPMEIGKASRPSGVAIELLKAAGVTCLKYMTNSMISCSRGSLVPLFKMKGGSLNPNSYRGIKLLEHAFKLYEKVLDGRLGEVIDIDKMKYGFIPVIGTVDTVLVLWRLSEKSRAKNKKLFFIFVDLKKAFNQVTKGSYSFCFEAEGCLRIFRQWGFVSL